VKPQVVVWKNKKPLSAWEPFKSENGNEKVPDPAVSMIFSTSLPLGKTFLHFSGKASDRSCSLWCPG
jgi:hypothetical protein